MEKLDTFDLNKLLLENSNETQKTIFTTKDKINSSLNSSDSLLIIYGLIRDFLKYEDKSILLSIFKYSEALNEDNQYEILHYLIEDGIYIAPLYANQLNLDYSNMHINSFIAGIKNGGDNLLYSDNYIDFLLMYKNFEELIIEIAENGYIEQFDYFKEEYSLNSISKNTTLTVMNNFNDRLESSNLLNKLNIYGLYDWDIIIDNIFQEPNYAKKIFNKIYTLSKKEKQELANLKVDVLNGEYYDEIDDIKEELSESGMQLINCINYDNDSQLEKNIKILSDELININTLKNYANEFNITILDITGKIKDFRLTTNITKLLYENNTYDNLNEYNNIINQSLNEYLNGLKLNNFNFSIIISKTIGNNDSDDNQNIGINNGNYEGKALKIA